MVAALVLAGLMVVVAFVGVHMSWPGRKRIGKSLPTFGTARHFRVGEKAGIELRLDGARIEIESHNGNGLAAIAEGLLPFFSGPLRHFILPGVLSSRGPPLTRARAMQ